MSPGGRGGEGCVVYEEQSEAMERKTMGGSDGDLIEIEVAWKKSHSRGNAIRSLDKAGWSGMEGGCGWRREGNQTGSS